MKTILCFTLILVLSAAKDVVASDTLSVLSWNIYMLPSGAKFTGKKKRAREIVPFLLQQNADVLMLQECFHPRAVSIITKALVKDYPHRLDARPNKGFGTTSGLMILSKYPLSETGEVKYDMCKGVDCWATKGYQVATVTVEGKAMKLINTHLQAGSGDKRDVVRESQSGWLMKEVSAQDGPVILAGDFNFKRRSVLYDRLVKETVASSEIDTAFSYDPLTNTRAKGAQKRIDFVFVSANNKLSILKEEVLHPVDPTGKSLSDHWPIKALVKID